MPASAPPLNLDRIQSYHAHIYFGTPEQRAIAATIRDEIGQRFSVQLGHWRDQPVGPQARGMYQVAFMPGEFARLVPWLMLNRRGLTILVHPNTGAPKADHLLHPLWFGEVLDIYSAVLPDHGEPEDDIIPNTQPSLSP